VYTCTYVHATGTKKLHPRSGLCCQWNWTGPTSVAGESMTYVAGPQTSNSGESASPVYVVSCLRYLSAGFLRTNIHKRLLSIKCSGIIINLTLYKEKKYTIDMYTLWGCDLATHDSASRDGTTGQRRQRALKKVFEPSHKQEEFTPSFVCMVSDYSQESA
jgi:hypothetical protein